MKKVIKKILCIIITIGCFAISYSMLKKNYEENQFNSNKVEIRKCFEPASILTAVLERKNWNNLALSENFKNKYKSKYDIIPDAKKCKNFSCGYSEINGKYLIYISSDVMESIFDLNDEKTITYEFYFDYKINENNELDDIELIKTGKYKTLTCEPIKEE